MIQKKIYRPIIEQYVEFTKVSFRAASEEYTLFDVMLLSNESSRRDRENGNCILNLVCDNGHFTS